MCQYLFRIASILLETEKVISQAGDKYTFSKFNTASPMFMLVPNKHPVPDDSFK